MSGIFAVSSKCLWNKCINSPFQRGPPHLQQSMNQTWWLGWRLLVHTQEQQQMVLLKMLLPSLLPWAELSISTLSLERPPVPGRWPAEAMSLPAWNTWLVKGFCKALFPPLPISSLSLWDFRQANCYLFLNSWEHQMEGEGEIEAQKKAGRGQAGAADEEGMFWNMGSRGTTGQAGRGRKGKKELRKWAAAICVMHRHTGLSTYH